MAPWECCIQAGSRECWKGRACRVMGAAGVGGACGNLRASELERALAIASTTDRTRNPQTRSRPDGGVPKGTQKEK